MSFLLHVCNMILFNGLESQWNLNINIPQHCSIVISPITSAISIFTMAPHCSSELPICNGIYTNETDSSGFLDGVRQFFTKYIQEYRAFFVGLCYHCYADGNLQRCGGCQLVAYCSRDCQKEDRKSHKYVCKEFPLVAGKNALYTKWSWKKHIADLRKRAAQLPDAGVAAAKPIFRNPRVCHNHTCRESRPDYLMDCVCECVCYCSSECARADYNHQQYCQELYHFPQLHAIFKLQPVKDLPSMKARSLCEKFTPLSHMSDIFPLRRFECYETYSKLRIVLEHLYYPMCLMSALQKLPERRLGQRHLPLEDLTTLDIHVVTSSPLFDSEAWEVFMHRLPKLKQLNVVFVMQGKGFKDSFILNNLATLSLRRCSDCEVKNRIITYSVKQMHYHMYFSSQDYTTPDVVVVYDNSYEMMSTTKGYTGDIHSEISYRNMTYDRSTVLVLIDTTKDLVEQGIRSVNISRPVHQLVSPQINPITGYCGNQADIDSDTPLTNDKHYFTCLRRNY